MPLGTGEAVPGESPVRILRCSEAVFHRNPEVILSVGVSCQSCCMEEFHRAFRIGMNTLTPGVEKPKQRFTFRMLPGCGLAEPLDGFAVLRGKSIS